MAGAGASLAWQRLLAQYGQPLVLRRFSLTTVDPISGGHGGGQVSELKLQGLVGRQRAGLAPGEMASADQQRVLLPAAGLDGPPQAGRDQVFLEGQALGILSVRTIARAGRDLAYVLQTKAGQ